MTLTPQFYGLSASEFPDLGKENSAFRATSLQTDGYNCFAWAMGVQDKRWEPFGNHFWPPGVPRALTMDAFIRAFATLGYHPCLDAGLQEKFERVAIFAKDGCPTHACYQLPCGLWTSKMGDNIDCEHNLHSIGGGLYGTVAAILRRKCPLGRRNHPALLLKI
jgi:hypothetical protein